MKFGGSLGTQTEARPGPAGLFDKAVQLGTAKTELPIKKMLALGVVSGAHVALGAFLAVSVGGSMPSIKGSDPGLQRALLGMFGLPMGLLMTTTGGGELVTGNMALCTVALLENKTTLQKVVRNWTVVLAGNFIGALLLAKLAATASTGVAPGAVAMATAKVSAPWLAAFCKGILCNWLVCMAVWMATSTPDIASKAAAVFFPVTGFVALGTEHCVANMFFLPFGMMQGADISVTAMFTCNLIPVTLGNLVGGSVFVAYFYVLAYGQYRAVEA